MQQYWQPIIVIAFKFWCARQVRSKLQQTVSEGFAATDSFNKKKKKQKKVQL